ncbi:MAG TPA: flavin reductase family protein [Bryobacteraceae bacterium]|nr:flavin reductase family protein [Bryobacteraceae bacterium]
MKTGSNQADQETAIAVSAEDFRYICGLFPSGVTVVTRRLVDGRPYGMTVSSFTSVSLEPPLILVCIEKEAGFVNGLEVGLPFLVNVLGEDQQHLARRFAERREDDRFSGAEWFSGWAKVPQLEGTVASFGCLLDRIVQAGDHVVLIGAVRMVQRHQGRALVWCERGYHCLPAPFELGGSEVG